MINAGGIIYAAGEYGRLPQDRIDRDVDRIQQTLRAIFERSEAEKRTPSRIADEIARERFTRG